MKTMKTTFNKILNYDKPISRYLKKLIAEYQKKLKEPLYLAICDRNTLIGEKGEGFDSAKISFERILLYIKNEENSRISEDGLRDLVNELNHGTVISVVTLKNPNEEQYIVIGLESVIMK